MVAGTRLRGMFEERFKDAVRKAEDADGKVILFIDEMHMLVRAGDEGGTTDAANLIKPALARGRVRCVGATTSQEYRRYIQADAALERRFQKVNVEEPGTQATIAILRGLKQRYQQHHGLKIQDDALVAAAQLADRYITGRRFPDKAIDVIDEACSTAKLQIRKQNSSTIEAPKEVIVLPSHVEKVVGRWTGIPINILDQEEKDKLIRLADRLRERVIGQDEAVDLVAKAVLRSRVGFAHPGQPISSFLFWGSSGVGKTQLATALAEKLFGSDDMLLRFDMSEYVGHGAVSRLIGGPGSYEDGGQLTEKVRERPYSVILFDEVDKAEPSVFNIFIQLLGDGTLTDGKGCKVNFKNTIIIMTSNVGADHIPAGIIAGETTIKVARDLLMKKVWKYPNKSA
uniref:Uncharacterized protein n=1 Tax=Avena sativa TaxID=4498 RepID=A0ACD5Y099_AVESA